MGMFDSMYIDHSLIKQIVDEAKIDLQLEVVDNYCSFQTKDLDNCLTNFYIMEDGSFYWKKQNYAPVDETLDPKDPIARVWSSLEPAGDPEYIIDTRNAYIDCYDFYYTDQERIFITFTVHVKEGRLAEPITIKNIEKTNLEEESIKHKKSREEWNKVTSAWQWKLATFIFDMRLRIKRIAYPLTNTLNNLEYTLRKQAKKNCNFQ